ncbi:MAG: ABC transporter permease subunit [Armatimonadetes bacterium]|nr:ABC transporter permease subunit [Armatimonadota bacterium]MDE2206712.1 ABC transporter permease subunit [Armatimonadota bacterium]
MVVIAIAQQTVREAMRRRVMWIFLIIGVFLIGLGPVFGFLSPKDSQTVLRSLGLAAILLAGLFITIVTCIYLIPTEIERRTIYTVLSKPVQRYEFVFGKFLGGFAVVFINIVSMGIVFLALIFLQEKRLPPEMIQGVMLTFFQMLLLAALSIFFSTFATPVVNFFMSFGIFLVGNLSSVTDSLTTNRNPIARGAGNILHFMLPNFGNFNIQNSIIHPQIEIQNEMVFIWQNIFYAIIYSAILLILAVIIFDRREV